MYRIRRYPEFETILFCSTSDRNKLLSDIFSSCIITSTRNSRFKPRPEYGGRASSKDLTKDMIRVKSSNVWSYSYNPKDNSKGDVYAQFKGKPGRPGDIYVYYDVPAYVYTKWLTASSKGKYFWRYIRNNYRYAKLTGDKRTKLKNGVNTL